MAPPPLAWPSIFVTTMAPKLALSLKARLCASAACPGKTDKSTWPNVKGSAYIIPILASSIKTVILGPTASPICTISWKSSASCLWRPDVSTRMTSKRSFLNFETPCAAIATGSVSVYEPKYATFALVADCRVWSKAPARNVSAQTMADLNPRLW